MASDSKSRILLVALAVCAVCAVLVSVAAVGLKPRQEVNQRMDKLRNILDAGGLLSPGVDVADTYNRSVRAGFVRLSDGSWLEKPDVPGGVTPEAFDFQRLAMRAGTGRALASAEDPSGLKRIPRFMPVFVVEDDAGKPVRLILPVVGKGLWSTLYGFLAMDPDLRTIRRLIFYDHGETPGLGGEIDNPRWQEKWDGKLAFGEDGRIRIAVLHGSVQADDPLARHHVDGISGATKTTQGVQSMVRFWLGGNGYGPFLSHAAKEGLHVTR
ncbi:MAG: Na(+)-translocating NADH-quinone reductase subunit C [Acidobacteriota bacterium]|jgi:Na+-transporting NADH:ubiquinone oxidoreductase subunit C|nr:Na(+)-translocating NADH-quinone reductase subunit C [Acidobacteriota bacterium]